MTLNMGGVDRVARVVIAAVAVALALTGAVTGVWAVVMYIVAAVLLLTAIVGFCPLYAAFGWHTDGKSPSSA